MLWPLVDRRAVLNGGRRKLKRRHRGRDKYRDSVVSEIIRCDLHCVRCVALAYAALFTPLLQSVLSPSAHIHKLDLHPQAQRGGFRIHQELRRADQYNWLSAVTLYPSSTLCLWGMMCIKSWSPLCYVNPWLTDHSRWDIQYRQSPRRRLRKGWEVQKSQMIWCGNDNVINNTYKKDIISCLAL